MKVVGVLGEGAWGTAIATVLAHNGYTVKLWCHDAQVAQSIAQQRCNQKYMPSVQLATRIIPTTYLQEAVEQVDVVFEAIPVKFLRSVLEQLKSYVSHKVPWVVLSKGIENDTLLLPTQLIQKIIGDDVSLAVVVGPSYAHELVKQQVTAVNIAAHDQQLANFVQTLLTTAYFKQVVINDMRGAQMCAALKNVAALLLGVLDGLGCGDNTKAIAFKRCIEIISLFVERIGGQSTTMYELCGIGDLVLTSFGKLSKNQELGRQLANGKSLESLQQKMGAMPEGINTLQAALFLQKKLHIQGSLFEKLHKFINGEMPAQALIDALLD